MIYSGFFRRLLAFMLDMLLVSIPSILLFGSMLTLQLENADVNPTDAQIALLGITVLTAQLVSVLIAWLYYALLESGKYQATLGKRLLGIKVVGKNGQRISFARATGRFFAKALSYLTLYIGFIMAGFTSQKRALHDLVAETYVVKKSYEPGQELPPTKSHKLLLTVVCLGWLALLAGASLFSSQLTWTPTQEAAQTAAQRLISLAQQGSRLTEPLRLETSTFYNGPEGYRAVVIDPASNNKFTLLLPRGSNQVCCQVFPQGDCQSTSFESCTD